MPSLAIFLVLLSSFIHAGWNLFLRNQRSDDAFLRMALVVSVIGLGPALLAEFGDQPILRQTGGYLLLAALFQAMYYLGLTQGYQSGDFTVVYPVARALPILLIALTDVARGHAPSLMAWLGMLAVSLGCMVLPLTSWRSFRVAQYWNRTTIWIIVTALAIVGYSTVDNAAAELIDPGPLMAARYGIFETAGSVPVYWLILKWLGRPTGTHTGSAGWGWAGLTGLSVFASYWLILWSYQLSSQASYVVALRQFSIILGVILGALFLREAAPMLRLSAACVIVVGIAGIVLGG